jgi:type IV pilus assembly protein PilO
MNLIRSILRIPPLLWFLVAGGLSYLDYSSWKTDVYEPLKQQIESAQGVLESTKNEITRASEFVHRRDEKIRELQELGQKLEQTRRELPRSSNIPDLLHSLADTSDQTGLDFSHFKPGKSVKTELLVETPIDVTLRGTYLQIMSFLDATANMTRVVAARKLTLDTPASRGSISVVNATATLVTYHIDDAGGEVANPPAPAGGTAPKAGGSK